MKDNKTIIIDYLRNTMKLNTYNAEKEYQGLHSYKDIEQEFVRYIINQLNDEDFLTVEGYTAKELNKKYPLSMLGAYNYLIYLREKPQEALIKLKKGLPRW